MKPLDPVSERQRHKKALRDGPSAALGVVLAIVVHLLVAVFAMRAGANEGNVSRANRPDTQTQPEDEEIIEGALLRQGGGGMFDPRRVVHREAPVQAEERNREFLGSSKNQNPNRVDAGVRRDPSARLTERDILGRGNQDLAERLERLAASEQAYSSAPPGPGSPDGSIHGTETDPSRAGTGAWAKVQSFLQNRLHLLASAPAAARRTFRLRIVISDDGTYIARGEVVQGSGDETVDSDLLVQLAQLAESRAPIPELTDAEMLTIRNQRRIVRYVPSR